MKYLTKFQTQDEYNDFIVSSAFCTPNVSKIGEGTSVEDCDVFFNPKSESKYLQMYALGDGEITFTIPDGNPVANIPSISYSKDNGEHWTTVNNVDGSEVVATVEVSMFDKVLFKSTCDSGTNWNSANTEAASYPAQFASTCKVNLGGNLASLMYGDDFEGKVTAKRSITHMFLRLFTNLQAVDASKLCLPYTTLTTGMYQKMFCDCTTLVKAPSTLPAKTCSTQAYYAMFYNCTSLREGPAIVATSVAKSAMTSMFYGCISLEEAPYLPAKTLADCCYMDMFNGCTSLTAIPAFVFNKITSQSCRRMFAGCSSLVAVPPLTSVTNTLGVSGCQAMFSACTSLRDVATFPTAACGAYCYGHMYNGCTSLTGLPSSLNVTLSAYCFCSTFGETKVDNAHLPTLPKTSLADGCYYGMFVYCTGITTGPALPAATLKASCYREMFYGCTNLTAAPALTAATTYAAGCFANMFALCSKLVNPPAMNATFPTNASACSAMFLSCTSLSATPQLTISTIGGLGCAAMFKGCTALKTNRLTMNVTAIGSKGMMEMFNGCTGLTDSFISSINVSLTGTIGTSGLYATFKDCKLITTAPTLTVPTLAAGGMASCFAGCTALVNGPDLVATALPSKSNCYSYMFDGCSSLARVKAMFTTTPATNLTNNWMRNVLNASSCIFIKNASATWTTRSAHGVPTNWTIQTASA